MKSGSSKYFYYLLLVLIFLMMASPDAVSQRRKNRNKDKDSLLTLLNAEYARVFERPGKREYREVKGPATFLHNGAYMFCDSAIWNVSFNQVEAYDNVKLVQDKTVVKSDNVIYYADDNLARFRGEVVEVYDKDKNTLRTKYLDYNTEDSTAKFTFGGAMKTSKGEVIESDRGTYDAKTGICRFEGNVEMFTDSLFIKTVSLDYDTNESKAYFGKKTQMWKNDIYMRGEYGWYMQDSGVVYFDTDVYLNNPDYEGWCDTLYFYQHEKRGRMRRNVQLLDSLHKMYFVSDAGNLAFDSIDNIYATLFLDPASIFVGENTEKVVDTMFIRSDTMLFYTQRVCDISEELKKDSEEAIQQVSFDAIGEADKKALEKKEQEKQKAIENLPEYKAYKKRQEIAQKKLQDSLDAAKAQAVQDSLAKLAADSLATAMPDSLAAALPDSASLAKNMVPGPPKEMPKDSSAEASKSAEESMAPAEMAPADTAPAAEQAEQLPAIDSISSPLDTLSVPDSLSAPLDSLAAADSLAVKDDRDTTQLRFMKGYRNVRIYRTDIQARCDSLYFSQLDTLIRMYEDPVIWNDNRHQLSGETVVMKMSDNSFDRANLHGNAMIISQEDTVHFDQIKSTEMLGYFNTDNTLRRFDALGGVNAMFFMQEDSVITILNSKQAQFMMVTMKDGVAERLKYYETVESDAFPVYGLPVEKQRLKGFKWRMEEQPKSRFDITDRSLRHSKRASYLVNKLPVFRRTDQYYDGYMKDIYHQIEERAEQARLEQARRDSIEAAEQELKSLAAADSTAGIATAFDHEGEVVIDSLATLKPAPAKDSLAAATDSAGNVLRPFVPVGKKLDSLDRKLSKAERDSLRLSRQKEKKDLGIEGIENHSDEGFVEVQVPDSNKKLTCKEKRAMRKAARELRRQQRRLEREARKAEKAARRAAKQLEREAKRTEHLAPEPPAPATPDAGK